MEENKQTEPVAEPAAHEVIKHDVEVDYDRSDPRAFLIAGLGIAGIIFVIIVVLGVQLYYDHIRDAVTYERVLAPISDDLKNLHAQEAEKLNTYKYLDRNKGIVQIPISRAMQLLAEEAANHKLTYFQKPTPVKPDSNTAAASAGATVGSSSAKGSTTKK